jgi:pyrroloquinoline quinone (PQQ) biosynthesis protein C
VAIDVKPARALPVDEFLEELEGLRREHMRGRLYRPADHHSTKEQVAESKRKRHVGNGNQNHKFVGEKYLNCPDKKIRRLHLRKLIDEGGQTTVGVGLPSHPTLLRWESNAFGVTDEEIDQLEKQDLPPDMFIWQGWRTGAHRTDHWAVGIGCSLVGEGEKLLPEAQQKMQREIEDLKREYAAMGIEDLDTALANTIEHASVDVHHAKLAMNTVRQYITTPELQDEMRRAYILTLHMKGF